MLKFLKQLNSMVGFMKLPKAQKRVVFYSEGPDYWPHLSGLVIELLKITNIPICYISSNKNDPGLQLTSPNYRTFYIADGYPTTVLFANIETDVMVMTMPDLDTYHLKRSKYKVHYVYIQHSLVSLHMVYRSKAFDNFDTIFCAGEHHIKEIRALEKTYKLPAKNLIKHGYGRLDAIREEASNSPKIAREKDTPINILIAPSWGKYGIIETIGQELIETLLTKGFNVTLRPHPQTKKLAGEKIKKILTQHQENPLFQIEMKISSQVSLHKSDLMISDWSGAAFDYAFGLNKPILFIDTPRKVNNPDYEEINIKPIEVSIRSQIGAIISIASIESISESINSLLSTYNDKRQEELGNQMVFNIGKANQVGADAIKVLLSKNL